MYTKGYRLYNPNTKPIVVARDVIFFEKSFETFDKSNGNTKEMFYADILNTNTDDVDVAIEDGDDKITSDKDPIETKNQEDEYSESSETEREDTPIGGKRKRGRPKLGRTGGRGRPRKVYCTEEGPEMLNSIIENPNTVAEALNSENSARWKEAMQTEYNSLIKNKTWQLVDKPNNKNIIGCNLLKIKLN